MALNVKVGSFTQKTTTGSQAYTGVGFQPKLILFFGNNKTSDGTTTNVTFFYGAATSSSNRWALSGYSTDVFLATGCRQTNAGCLTLVDDGTTLLLAADFTSMDSDGFTLNYSTTDGTARVVNYVALGGTDITNVYAGAKLSGTSTGDLAVTDPGFTPDCLLTFTNTNDGTLPNSNFGYMIEHTGVATSTSSRWVTSAGEDAGEDPTNTYRKQISTKVLSTLAFAAVLKEADLTSFDANGFTLNFSTNGGGNTYFFYVAIKGAQFATGQFNQSTSTGNQAITGTGFTPSLVFLSSFNNAATTSVVASARHSIGAATSSSSRFTTWWGDLDNSSGSAVCDQNLNRTKILEMLTEGTPTLNTSADFVSMDSNGFTINNTTADATSREINYWVIGATAGAAAAFLPRLTLLGVG